jgi:hypothetical protein
MGGHDVGLVVMESAMRDDIIYIISRQHQKVDGASSGHFLKNRRSEEQPTTDPFPLAHDGYPQYLYDIFSLSNNVIDLFDHL